MTDDDRFDAILDLMWGPEDADNAESLLGKIPRFSTSKKFANHFLSIDTKVNNGDWISYFCEWNGLLFWDSLQVFEDGGITELLSLLKEMLAEIPQLDHALRLDEALPYVKRGHGTSPPDAFFDDIVLRNVYWDNLVAGVTDKNSPEYGFIDYEINSEQLNNLFGSQEWKAMNPSSRKALVDKIRRLFSRRQSGLDVLLFEQLINRNDDFLSEKQAEYERNRSNTLCQIYDILK